MTDRELLEGAAKAAGIEIAAVLHEGGKPVRVFLEVGQLEFDGPVEPIPGSEWNPLADDGDALRLAVKLKMQILAFNDWCSAGSYVQCGEREDYGNDPYAATRRAIVRAAAEVGKAMP